MDAFSTSSRLPFFNPELHALAFCVVGNHEGAQNLVERALSAYALHHQELEYGEHPWTLSIDELSEWTPKHRLELMEQLWEVLKREKVSASNASGFYGLGVSERIALFLRARTPLDLEDIARLLQISNADTVALLERARRELLEREAPGLLAESDTSKCRHSMKAEALAALDVDRFSDDFLVRHMESCQTCTESYSAAKKKRDAWLAFIPEGTIPREMQREFEERLPKMLKEVLPENRNSMRFAAKKVGRGSAAVSLDLARTLVKPGFVFTVAGVVILTLAFWASRN
tara:strand:+ start:404 stop:1264 length:861 start_codon:yes stop_codon:yes gene_type:complete